MPPKFLTLLGVTFSFGAPSLGLAVEANFAKDAKAVYGVDERFEVNDPRNPEKMVRAAMATVVLVRKSDILPGYRDQLDHAHDPRRIVAQTLGTKMKLCEGEAFFDEPAPGYCSGFLAGKDLVVTAGHCIRSPVDCSHTAIVFNFSYRDGVEDPTILSSKSIFSCDSIVQRVQDHATGIDFAIIKLDRPVPSRKPLRIRRRSKVEDHAALTVIGHPGGIPTKIAGNGKIRDNTAEGFFLAAVDTADGSSGSPVLNTQTGLVEGIVVRGEKGFAPSDHCFVTKICPEDGCRGEDVTRATAFAPFLTNR